MFCNTDKVKQRILIKLYFNDCGEDDLCLRLFVLLRPCDVKGYIREFLENRVILPPSFRVSYSLGSWASDRGGNKYEVRYNSKKEK